MEIYEVVTKTILTFLRHGVYRPTASCES